MIALMNDCCDYGIEPMVAGTATSFGRPSRPISWAFRPYEGNHYFAYPLTYACFWAGASNYEPDELYCPCGKVLQWEDQNIGTAIDIIDHHIGEAHPEATKSARAKRRREAAKP